MIKTTGAIDRIIATAAGITAQARIASVDDVIRMAGREVASVKAAARRGLVTIFSESHNGINNQVTFELTDLGLERAIELEELHADPKTGKIPFTVLVNL